MIQWDQIHRKALSAGVELTLSYPQSVGEEAEEDFHPILTHWQLCATYLDIKSSVFSYECPPNMRMLLLTAG